MKTLFRLSAPLDQHYLLVSQISLLTRIDADTVIIHLNTPGPDKNYQLTWKSPDAFNQLLRVLGVDDKNDSRAAGGSVDPQ